MSVLPTFLSVDTERVFWELLRNIGGTVSELLGSLTLMRQLFRIRTISDQSFLQNRYVIYNNNNTNYLRSGQTESGCSWCTCVYLCLLFGHSTSVFDEQQCLDLASCVILVRINIWYLKFFPTFCHSLVSWSLQQKGCKIPSRPHPLFSLTNVVHFTNQITFTWWCLHYVLICHFEKVLRADGNI